MEHEVQRLHKKYELNCQLRVYQVAVPETVVIPAIGVEISEATISAIMPANLPANDMVELDIELPAGRITAPAAVRARRNFRYEFEFVDLTDAQREKIRKTCTSLKVYRGTGD
jgi:hypothetical protein